MAEKRPLLVWLCGALLCACAEAAPPLTDAMPAGDEDLMAAGSGTVIRVHYPLTGRGQGMALRGALAPLSWGRGAAMTRRAGDLFELRLRSLTAPLEFKPLIDDSTWSRGENYVVAPGQVVDVYPHFFTEQGQWARRWPAVHSAILSNDRGVWVYLPPSYNENPLGRFPVLYMHDGQNLFDPAAAFGGHTWRVAETLDAGIDALDPSQHLPEVIVVGAENTAQRIYEYTPTAGGMGGGGGDLYLRFLIEELKPKVDAELRTQPEATSTALGGSSLGGLITAYAGVKRPDVFARLAVVSPSTWWDGRYILGAVAGSKGQSPRPQRVYVDSGDSGPSNDDVDNTRELAATYRQNGYRDNVDLLYVVGPGDQHSEIYWAGRLPAALRFLLKGW